MPRSSGHQAMPRRAIRFDASVIVSVPSNVIEPSRRGTTPMIDFSVVVLPAPLRPSSVTTSPAVDVEVDAMQDVRLAVPRVEIAHGEERRSRRCGGARNRGRGTLVRHGRFRDRPRMTPGCFDTCA